MENNLKVFEDTPFYTSLGELKNDLRVGDFVLVKLIPERNTFAKVVGITVNGVILDPPRWPTIRILYGYHIGM